MPSPVDQRFVEVPEELALLKINSNDKQKMKDEKVVIADLDVSMKIA